VLEDGARLRLLEGFVAKDRKGVRLENTPTRFGRVNLQMEPAGSAGWRLTFAIEGEPSPKAVELPAMVGGSRFRQAETAMSRAQRGKILIDPASRKWSVLWR
jgi:hypothetical protein